MTYKSIYFSIFLITYSGKNISSLFTGTVWVIVKVNQNIDANIQKIKNKSTSTVAFFTASFRESKIKLPVQNTFAFLQHKTTCETYSCMTYKSINFTIFMFTYSWLNISSTFIVWVIVRVNQNLHANIQKIQNKSTGTKYSCNYYNTKLLVQNTFVWHRYQTTLLYLLVHNHGRTYQTQLE